MNKDLKKIVDFIEERKDIIIKIGEATNKLNALEGYTESVKKFAVGLCKMQIDMYEQAGEAIDRVLIDYPQLKNHESVIGLKSIVAEKLNKQKEDLSNYVKMPTVENSIF